MGKSTKKWIAHVEDVLIRLLIFFIMALLLSQVLLLKEGTRSYLSKVDQMEGEDLTAEIPLYAHGPQPILEEQTVVKNFEKLLRRSKVIVIKMITFPKHVAVYVLINGKPIADFSQGQCTLTVYEGDYVEIDGRALKELTQFIIKVPDKKLQSPQDGLIVEGREGILTVGKIKFKND